MDSTKKPVAAAKKTLKAANKILEGLETLHQLYVQKSNNLFELSQLANASEIDWIGIEHIDSSIITACLDSGNNLFKHSVIYNIMKAAK